MMFTIRQFSRIGRRCFSEWSQRGHDITFESLTFGSDRPKVILQGYSPTGFDVFHCIKKVDPKLKAESGTLHYNGSILIFPYGCFLWKIEDAKEVSIESLAPVLLHRPKLEYFFLGSNKPIPNLSDIQQEFRKHKIVVEQLNLANTMGTYNILNAEDRSVGAALIIDREET